MEELNSIAEEALPNFKKVAKNQLYVEYLNNNLSAIWNGAMTTEPETLDWSDDAKAKNYSAMKKAYKQYLASSPEVIDAAKRAGKKEAEERTKEVVAAGGSAGTTTSSTTKEPPEKTTTEDLIDRMVNARGHGKRFGVDVKK
jgi:hypothetical protein